MYKGICLFFIVQVVCLNLAVSWFSLQQKVEEKRWWIIFILLLFGGFIIAFGVLLKNKFLCGASNTSVGSNKKEVK